MLMKFEPVPFSLFVKLSWSLRYEVELVSKGTEVIDGL